MKAYIPALLCGALLMTAQTVEAQRVPGYSGDYGMAEAEYRALALKAFQETVGDWTSAVQSRDLDDAMDLYSDQVFAYLDGPASGKAAVRAQLQSWLDGINGFTVNLVDFDASGRLAYGSVRLNVVPAGAMSSEPVTMLFVLRRVGRDWYIRSQSLIPE